MKKELTPELKTIEGVAARPEKMTSMNLQRNKVDLGNIIAIRSAELYHTFLQSNPNYRIK